MHIERRIQTAEVNIIPSLTSSAPTQVAIQCEQEFIKGNLEIDFGDNEIHEEWLNFAGAVPSTTVQHR